jgi:hypothetical protein
MNRGIVIVTVILALSLNLGFISSGQVHASTGSTGIVVPLYTYPTSDSWSTLISIKQSHPSVPIIAVINPNNGPGTSMDSKYLSGIKQLQAAGITVLGYVHTSYGSRSTRLVEREMSIYKNWYGVNGIFFDEMGSSGVTLRYYAVLANYSKQLNFAVTMGNPGKVVSTNLVGVFTNLCIYENQNMPKVSDVDGLSSYGKVHFSYIAYGVSGIPDQSTIQNTANYVGYLYITDLSGSNPYNGLPSYLAGVVSSLD